MGESASRTSYLLSLLLGATAIVALAGGLIWWLTHTKPERSNKSAVPIEPPTAPKTVATPKVRFRDITAKAGINFVHCNGASGKKLLPETMGSGVAFFDYDLDGKPDLLLINSCYWPGLEPKGPRPRLALYRNRGDGAFEDVTESTGLGITLYGMGVTVGDYDNDGRPDIYITAMG